MSKDAPGRFSRFVQRIDKDPRLVKLLRLGRARLPGDERYGDPLSLTGDQAPAVLGRRLSALTAEEPGKESARPDAPPVSDGLLKSVR